MPTTTVPRRSPAGTDRAKRARARPTKIAHAKSRGQRIVRAVTIRRSPEELQGFWRDVRRLAQLARCPLTITPGAPGRSHWSATSGKTTCEWDVYITKDEPGRLIAWHLNSPRDAQEGGMIKFERAPGDEGTEVTFILEYDPPGTGVKAFLSKFSRDSVQGQVADALRRFKALMEAGEIPTTEGQPVGGPQARKGTK